MTQLVQFQLKFTHPSTPDPLQFGLDYLSLFGNSADITATANDAVASFAEKALVPPLLGTYGDLMAGMDAQTELQSIDVLVWADNGLAGAWQKLSALPYVYGHVEIDALMEGVVYTGGRSGTVLTSGLAAWCAFSFQSNLFGTPPAYVPHRGGIFYGPLAREDVSQAGVVDSGLVGGINIALNTLRVVPSSAETWDYFMCRFVQRGATAGYNIVSAVACRPSVTLMSRRSNRR